MRIVGLLCVFSAFSASASWGQQLEFEGDTLHFGAIAQRSEARRTIRLRNTGDKPLLIDAIRTSCGCTEAVAEKMELAPNESTTLTVEYDTRKRGAFRRYVFFKTNALNADKYGESVLPVVGEVLKVAKD